MEGPPWAPLTQMETGVVMKVTPTGSWHECLYAPAQFWIKTDGYRARMGEPEVPPLSSSHHVAVWIANDAKKTAYRFRDAGPNFRWSLFLGLNGHRVYLFAGARAKPRWLRGTRVCCRLAPGRLRFGQRRPPSALKPSRRLRPAARTRKA